MSRPCRRTAGGNPPPSCGLTIGSGPGSTALIEQIAGAAAECDTREHRVGRAEGRERARGRRHSSWWCRGCGRSRWSRRRRCCRPCASCRHRGASCRGRRDDSLNAASAASRCASGAGGTGMARVALGQYLERLVAGEDQRDLIGDRIHLIPCRAIVVGLGTAGKVLRAGLGVAEMNHGLGPLESVSGVDRSMKLSGLRGVISPMPRMVMTTVSSVARSMSSMCSSVGIFLKSSASESMPSLLNPEAVIWKWNVRPLAALPFTSNAETLEAGNRPSAAGWPQSPRAVHGWSGLSADAR